MKPLITITHTVWHQKKINHTCLFQARITVNDKITKVADHMEKVAVRQMRFRPLTLKCFRHYEIAAYKCDPQLRAQLFIILKNVQITVIFWINRKRHTNRSKTHSLLINDNTFSKILCSHETNENMQEPFDHNTANAQNAYSTALHRKTHSEVSMMHTI